MKLLKGYEEMLKPADLMALALYQINGINRNV